MQRMCEYCGHSAVDIRLQHNCLYQSHHYPERAPALDLKNDAVTRQFCHSDVVFI